MNIEQRQALLSVQDGHSIYIGGSAGTGKSYLARQIVSWARRTGKQVSLTCTTGVACCLYPQVLNPMTIHKWSGLGDGRMTVGQLANLTTDDRYVGAFNRIKQADILVIDEISMFSAVMFEKLEGLMRKLRGNDFIFGGCQLVLVGDFLQLPPVRNARYGDQGDFCFVSDSFPKHGIFLKQVLRQNDTAFSNVINVLAQGYLDTQTIQYVKGLSRPLSMSTTETVRLFSTNILADMYNRDCLMMLPGDVYEFEARDTGEERNLASLTVQKTLWLKKNAKVMLLRNLSDQLVNGLCGTVVDVREGEVDVMWSTLNKLGTLTRMNFAVFDPSTNRNLAVRNQIPLKLCYAMTVHKAQGMTLSRVEVDCRQIFQPGQLAVAMGRVRSPDGLRVVNFSMDAVIPQSQLVVDFLQTQTEPMTADMSCCHYRHPTTNVETASSEETDPLVPTYVSECDVDISPDLIIDDETDKVLSTIDMRDLSQSQTVPEPAHIPLPTEFIVEKEIEQLSFAEPVRENQIIHNQWIKYLLEQSEKLTQFCSLQYSHLMNMYKTTVKESQKQKSQTEFFRAFQMYTTSSAYKSTVLNLMPETDHVNVVFQLAFDILSLLRKLVIHKMSENLPDVGFCDISKRQLGAELTDTAKGKIRYIGGYVVAKLSYQTCLTVQRNAYKTSADNIESYESGKRTLKLIHCMECTETSLQHSDFPESLQETARKQNINRGLINITDAAYKFFECLINTVLFFLTGEHLNKHGAGLHKHITESVSKDSSLHQHFLDTVQTGYSTDDVSFDNETTAENEDYVVTSCLHELTYNADVANELYLKIVGMVIAVLLKQFSQDIASSMNIKKKLEHRKQIHISTDKRSKSKTGQNESASLRKKLSTSTQKSKKTKKKTTATECEEQGSTTSSTDNTDLEQASTSTSTAADDTGETICPKCNTMYSDGEDWICCDSCDQWLDRKCAGLKNALKWRKFSKKNSKFICDLCQ